MGLYRELVLSRVVAAIGAAKAVGGIGHPGVKGHLREIVIRELLRPLLPLDVGLGTGVVVSVDDRHSSEQDVVMFDRRILPPIVLEQATGVFPIESVLFCVEVKSVLTASELRSAHDNAVALEQFSYHTGTFGCADIPQPQEGIRLINAVFALDSDLTGSGKTEVQRYDEVRGCADPGIRSLCVVGKGNWYWESPGRWKSAVTQGEMPEVMGFLAGILNTYPLVAESRRRPRIGFYL
jgi:hypothetical protein